MHARHPLKPDLHHADSTSLAMRTAQPRHSFNTSSSSIGTHGGVPPSPSGRNTSHGGFRGGGTFSHSPRSTLSGSGKARGRRKKRYPVLFLLGLLMTVWVFAPAIHHVVTGIHKVFIRGLLFKIDRPDVCLPSTPAPSDLADDDPIEGLPAADLTDLPGTIPTGRPAKVGIISLCDHNVDAICAASVANKQQYADRHGYDVIVDGDVIDETRPTSWSKLLAMRKYLPYYDYLFYVDADTLVTNPELKLEDIVDYGYDQILAADRNGLNCGVWLIRNTPWSLWFLDEMWAQTQLVNPQTFVLFHYEQRAMHYLYQSKVWTASVKQPAYQQANTVRARTKVINACVFNSYPAWYRKDDFIVHLAGLKGIAKCLTFRHYYQKAQQKFALSGTSLGSVGEETDVPAPSWGTCFFGRI